MDQVGTTMKGIMRNISLINILYSMLIVLGHICIIICTTCMSMYIDVILEREKIERRIVFEKVRQQLAAEVLHI